MYDMLPLVEQKDVKALKSAVLQGKLSFDDGKSDMKEDLNVDQVKRDEDCIEDEVYTKMTMEERKEMGFLVMTQEETRIAVKVCYVQEYGEPDEDDWPPIIKELSTRFRVQPYTVKRVFMDCCGGKKDTEKQKRGRSETQA